MLKIIIFLSIAQLATSLASNPIQWLDCSRHAPKSLSLTKNELASLPSTLHCGKIDVPMDYSRPMCRDNMISVGFAMHRPRHPKGVIFV